MDVKTIETTAAELVKAINSAEDAKSDGKIPRQLIAITVVINGGIEIEKVGTTKDSYVGILALSGTGKSG